jgi:hypothetical protein
MDLCVTICGNATDRHYTSDDGHWQRVPDINDSNYSIGKRSLGLWHVSTIILIHISLFTTAYSSQGAGLQEGGVMHWESTHTRHLHSIPSLSVLAWGFESIFFRWV